MPQRPRPTEIVASSKAERLVERVLSAAAEKRNCLLREERQLEHTSCELVCALGWKVFPRHVLTRDETQFIRELYTKVGYTLRNKRVDPWYAFTLGQKLALADITGEVTYVEGYRGDRSGVHYYAWCDYHGKLIDLATVVDLGYTDKHAHRLGHVGVFPSDVDYVGRPIPNKLVQDLLDERGQHRPVLLMYEDVYGDVRAGRIEEGTI